MRVQVIAMDGMYAGFAGAKTGHGPMALFGGFVLMFLPCATLATFGRCHINPVFAIGAVRRPGKNPVESDQVHYRAS